MFIVRFRNFHYDSRMSLFLEIFRAQWGAALKETTFSILPIGGEFARKVKREEKLKHIPIILISAEVENLEINERKVGVVGYYQKPFEMKALIGMIENQSSAGV